MVERRLSDYSRAELVARDLSERIREGNLSPGHRLGTKEDLREDFGVAPATLNETLKLLRARRLITIRPGPGGGVFVADQPAMVRLGHKVLNLDGEAVSVSDCLAVRDALDGLVADEAARHASQDDIEDLTRILEELEEDAEDPRDYLHHNWRLHLRIAEITPNAILNNYYIGVLEFVESHLQDVTPLDGLDFGRGIRVHRDLVEAITAHDPGQAREAIRDHHRLTEGDLDELPVHESG